MCAHGDTGQGVRDDGTHQAAAACEVGPGASMVRWRGLNFVNCNCLQDGRNAEIGLRMLPVNLLFVGMIGSSFYALQNVGVGMVTVWKNLSNVVTAIGDIVIYKKHAGEWESARWDKREPPERKLLRTRDANPIIFLSLSLCRDGQLVIIKTCQLWEHLFARQPHGASEWTPQIWCVFLLAKLSGWLLA
eukprot:1155900-Pelagomonas_calceolata.AAC.7